LQNECIGAGDWISIPGEGVAVVEMLATRKRDTQRK
jgi:hypothetical protein